MTRKSKTYSELLALDTFSERFEYLRTKSRIGEETFGAFRYLNQALYTSEEWKSFRRKIILRDNGCDLGCDDRPYSDREIVIIHHINPLTKEQILNRDPCIFDPENVISCRDSTHKALHYGSLENVEVAVIERKPNDTCPWRH